MATRFYPQADAVVYATADFGSHGNRVPDFDVWDPNAYPAVSSFWNWTNPVYGLSYNNVDGWPANSPAHGYVKTPYNPMWAAPNKGAALGETGQGYIDDVSVVNANGIGPSTPFPIHYPLAVAWSSPLKGDQTIAGTFRALLYAGSDNASTVANMGANVVIRVVSGDGLTQRGVLYAGDSRSTILEAFPHPGPPSPNCWKSTWFPQGAGTTPVTLSSVNALDGDRIVMEFGATVYSGWNYPFIGIGRPLSITADLTTTGSIFNNTTGLTPWAEFSQNIATYGPVAGDISIDMGGWAGLAQNPPIGGTAALVGQTDLDVQDTGYIIELRSIAGTLDVPVDSQGYLVKALFGSIDVDVDMVTDARQIQPAPSTTATIPTQWLDPVQITKTTWVYFEPLKIRGTSTLTVSAVNPIVIPSPPPTQPGEIPEEPGNFGSPIVGGLNIRALHGVTVGMYVPQITGGKPVGDNADQTVDNPVPVDPGGGGGGGGGGGMPG